MRLFWGKELSFDLPYVLFVLCLCVILDISHFGFEGGTMVLIASVPDLDIVTRFLDTWNSVH